MNKNTRICYVCENEIALNELRVGVGKGHMHVQCSADRDAKEKAARAHRYDPFATDESVCAPGCRHPSTALDALGKRARREKKLKALHEVKCPACQSPKTTAADDWELSTLSDEVIRRETHDNVPVYLGRGGTPYSACLNCGVIFVPKAALKKVKTDIESDRVKLRDQLQSAGQAEKTRYGRDLSWTDAFKCFVFIAIFATLAGVACVGFELNRDGINSSIIDSMDESLQKEIRDRFLEEMSK